jgi:membrane peptidoglycan carboxypeptidase
LSVALQHGRSVNDTVCAPSVATVPNPGGTPNPYPIHNAEAHGGCYTLASALQQSVNTVYGPLALKVGLKQVLRRAVAAGFAPEQRVLRPLVPAKSIGGGLEVTPMSEAVAFSTLAAHGVRRDPRSILTVRSGANGGPDSGNIVYRAPQADGKQVMPAHVADAVTEVMKGVVDHGTATAARQPFPVFGKTGTTNDETDAWFVGCTHKLCIATWMGYDRPFLKDGSAHSMQNIHGVGSVYGGTLPARIFASAWDNYRTIKEAEKHPGRVAAPSPSPRPHAVRTTHRPKATHSATPRPTRSATPRPTPTVEPPPTPTARPTRTRPPITPPPVSRAP